MKRIFLIAVVLIFSLNLFAQDFFREDFDKKKQYIILTNPTIRNLKTMDYLVDSKLLKINTGKVKFVGVYYKEQKYDFTETQKYIEENHLDNFFLHEINGNPRISNMNNRNYE